MAKAMHGMGVYILERQRYCMVQQGLVWQRQRRSQVGYCKGMVVFGDVMRCKGGVMRGKQRNGNALYCSAVATQRNDWRRMVKEIRWTDLLK